MKKISKITPKKYKRLARLAESVLVSETEKPSSDRDDALIEECVETLLFCGQELEQLKADNRKRTVPQKQDRLRSAVLIAAVIGVLAAGVCLISVLLGRKDAENSHSAATESDNFGSAVYLSQEIESAFYTVKSIFSKNWKECELRNLSFAGDGAAQQARINGAYGSDYKVMVLKADITMGDKKTVLYEPNTYYPGSEWVLVKNPDDSWTVRDNVASELFTAERINEAADAAVIYFYKNWTGCELYRLSYAGDDAVRTIKKYGSYGDDKVIIVLNSDFAVSADADDSLEPNTVYTDYNWVLVMDENGDWIVCDSGY